MDRKLVDRIEAVLKEDGFAQFSKSTSPHSLTLSASKGEVRVVLHITDQQEVPGGSAVSVDVPDAGRIKVRANFPPLTALTGGVPDTISGRGGAQAQKKEKGD
jgi:hypothetical protein